MLQTLTYMEWGRGGRLRIKIWWFRKKMKEIKKRVKNFNWIYGFDFGGESVCVKKNCGVDVVVVVALSTTKKQVTISKLGLEIDFFSRVCVARDNWVDQYVLIEYESRRNYINPTFHLFYINVKSFFDNIVIYTFRISRQ